MTSKASQHFEQTSAFDELEPDDIEVQTRRMRLYSKAALKIGIAIDQIYINHTRFSDGLNALDRVFQLAPEVHMAHGVRLIGPTGSGKSTLFRYFRDSLPRSSLFSAGYGAIGVRFGGRPTAGQLVSAILRAYKYPFSTTSGKTVYAKCDIAYDLIKEKGTRLLFVDEAHRLLNQVRRREGQSIEPDASVVLRDLMDNCRLGLALAGTDSLDALGTVDSHLYDRVSARVELRNFDSDAQWAGLLRAFRKQCDVFDLRLLEDSAQAKRLHLATGGSLRRFKRLLTEAVLIAVSAGKDALDVESLAAAVLAVQGFDSLDLNPYA